MITRSQSKRVEVAITENEPPKEQEKAARMDNPASSDKISCPPFSIDGPIEITQWLKFYEKKCEEKKFDDEKKLSMFSEYLNTDALSFYINQCMDINDFSEVKTKFSDHFTKGKQVTFDDFVKMKLEMFTDVNKYFNSKVEAASKLGLEEKVTVESLNHGLPPNYRNILSSHQIENTSAWIRIARNCVTSIHPEPQRSIVPRQSRPPMPPTTPPYHPRNNFRPQWRPPQRGYYHYGPPSHMSRPQYGQSYQR